MFELPYNVTFESLKMELMQIPYAHLLRIAIALSLVAISAAYLYFTKKPKGCLDPDKFNEFKLVKKTQLSQNTARFRFSLPTPTSVLGLPVGQHIICRGKDNQGEEVTRPYTPITLDSNVGYFELVVKMYPKGKMSHHFRELKEGDYLSVKGPKLIRAILENPKDKTNVHLMYANVTLDDILLKEELDAFARNFPNRFKVFYVLNQPPVPWNGGVGFITKEMIQTHCPAPAPDVQILRCGPPAMNKAMKAHLDALEYTSDMQFEF
ncbi:hypothetical protein I3842_13G047000 [Carya illinoinensis]|uniref:cytochrome-b5 reductase n=1 Tax=Carya illinoinensis TaxID=32201 RepID=A0A922AFS3_CARIL|nr:hypothetical protein I3842_13G047000 [Carya illinoinensis]